MTNDHQLPGDDVVAPSFKLARFTCTSCHELADQVWLNAYAQPVNNPEGVPLRIEGEGLEMLSKNPQFPPEVREQKVAYWNRVNDGEVFLDRWAPVQTDLFVAGLELSVCSSCMGTLVWAGGKKIFPQD
ncbi:MAG: hypothetical protein ACR2P6_03910 [Gammaproteobacteria bacterium]